MNRKILYRGLNVETKKWVYGSFFIQIMPIIDTERCFIKDETGYDCAVIRESVGQLTGKQFTDNLGTTDIYEGDIDPKGNEIIWSENNLGWFVKPASGGEEEPLYQTFFRPVGNIHEKPAFKSNIDIKLEKTSDVIKRHLGANTPGWIIDNAIKAFEELNSMRQNNEI